MLPAVCSAPFDRRAQSARRVRSVRPQFASYSLEIRHGLGAFPEVRVLSPGLVRRGLEPVSAQTQPVSERLVVQISDIENSSSRDTPPNSRPSVPESRNCSPETGLLTANLRKCRFFAKSRKSPERDYGAWLGCQDSNRDVSNFEPPVGASKTGFAWDWRARQRWRPRRPSIALEARSDRDPFGPKPATR
jgi:hypothetical protein